MKQNQIKNHQMDFNLIFRTYFTYYQTGVGFTEDLTGFDIARRIMEFKKEYLEK